MRKPTNLVVWSGLVIPCRAMQIPKMKKKRVPFPSIARAERYLAHSHFISLSWERHDSRLGGESEVARESYYGYGEFEDVDGRLGFGIFGVWPVCDVAFWGFWSATLLYLSTTTSYYSIIYYIRRLHQKCNYMFDHQCDG